ncbi:hypothetical protein NPIL_396091 [Nephila pilipes]|uniref:Uncharacterized protein n=1 Tax=Nephila pilipes TaxID=299642 RepID=A0A8X6NPV8_NEPPI|nr:hypothetical protein NPIL_396091 [Nephila pilipes]
MPAPSSATSVGAGSRSPKSMAPRAGSGSTVKQSLSGTELECSYSFVCLLLQYHENNSSCRFGIANHPVIIILVMMLISKPFKRCKWHPSSEHVFALNGVFCIPMDSTNCRYLYVLIQNCIASFMGKEMKFRWFTYHFAFTVCKTMA